MGFRSTFVTEDTFLTWPAWFKEKYDGVIKFNTNEEDGCLSSVAEFKTYGILRDLPTDIQRCLLEYNEVHYDCPVPYLNILYFHECEGVTRCRVSIDEIVWSEPTSWQRTQGIGHCYCYGCSLAIDPLDVDEGE